MKYWLLQNFKINDIKQKVLKKTAPKKDNRNPDGFNQTEKEQAISLLMKSLKINEKQANTLFYSKSGQYREELLAIENRENEIKFCNIVENGNFRIFFGKLRYFNLIKEEIITANLTITKALPKIKIFHRTYLKQLHYIKLFLTDQNGKKIRAKYYFKHCIYKEGFYLSVRNYYRTLANKIKGSISISYTDKTKYAVSISKDLDKIMS